MIFKGWDWGVPGIDYPANAEDYRMTDDEILDECRQRFARDLAMTREEYLKAYASEPGFSGSQQAAQQGIANGQQAAAQNIWNQHANSIYGITEYVADTGDETSPSESNPVPIEEIYPEPKTETEEGRRDRLWKAVQVSSIT